MPLEITIPGTEGEVILTVDELLLFSLAPGAAW